MKFFLSVFIPPQLYLFLRLRGCIAGKIIKPRVRAGFLFAAAIVFTIMPTILVWQAFLGHNRFGAHSHLRRMLLTASITWGVGSIACAALLFLYSLFRGANPFRSHDTGSPQPDSGRRQFLQQLAGVAVTAPLVLSGSGAVIKRGRFDIDHFDVPVEGISSALSGFTVVQLTDIHVGPFMTGEELAGFVEATNRLKPDLIVLTGDFIAGSPMEVAPCVETLAGLRAHYGIFACIGNHEIYAKAEEILTQGLEGCGIRVLRNHGVSAPVGNTRLALLGIDDLRAGKPDLFGALNGIQKKGGEAKILLSHRPEIFPWASRAGVDLILSGHYHGGQIKLGRHPESLSVARFLTPYAEGFFQLPRAVSPHESDKRRSTLFVGRGVGISGLPIRINCTPQIAHLTLNKA
jgi:uncharacterized protein